MIPQDFITFFAASLTADGALIGLLFVAIAIKPEHTFGEAANQERALAANGAFSALVNAFLISMLALIPRINVGWAFIVIAGLSLLNTIVQAIDKLRRGQQTFNRSVLYTASGLLLYGLEIFYSVHLIQQPYNTDGLYSLIIVLVAIYGVALARAWTLLGAENRSFLRMLIDAITRRRTRTQTAASSGDEPKSGQKAIPPV